MEVTINQDYSKKHLTEAKTLNIYTKNNICALKLVWIMFSEYGFENDILDEISYTSSCPPGRGRHLFIDEYLRKSRSYKINYCTFWKARNCSCKWFCKTNSYVYFESFFETVSIFYGTPYIICASLNSEIYTRTRVIYIGWG